MPRATSIMDYIFRWLALKFVEPLAAAGEKDGVAAQEADAAAREMRRGAASPAWC